MRGEWTAGTSRTVDLGYDQLLVLEARPGDRVRVLYGQMWLTEEGSARDTFAASGEEVALRSRGRAVIEGLGLARVQVIEPGRSAWRVRWADSVHRFLRPLRSLQVAALRLLHA